MRSGLRLAARMIGVPARRRYPAHGCELALCDVVEKAFLRTDDVLLPILPIADMIDRLIRVPQRALTGDDLGVVLPRKSRGIELVAERCIVETWRDRRTELT